MEELNRMIDKIDSKILNENNIRLIHYNPVYSSKLEHSDDIQNMSGFLKYIDTFGSNDYIPPLFYITSFQYTNSIYLRGNCDIIKNISIYNTKPKTRITIDAGDMILIDEIVGDDGRCVLGTVLHSVLCLFSPLRLTVYTDSCTVEITAIILFVREREELCRINDIKTVSLGKKFTLIYQNGYCMRI